MTLLMVERCGCEASQLGAGGAIAHVAHGQLAGERRQVGVGEHTVEQAQILADHNRAAVTHGDSRRFLATVLQRTQAKVRKSSHIAIGRPYAEIRIPHAAGRSPDHTSTWSSPVPRRARPRGWFLYMASPQSLVFWRYPPYYTHGATRSPAHEQRFLKAHRANNQFCCQTFIWLHDVGGSATPTLTTPRFARR